VVGATNAGHKRAADALDALRKFGTSDQIAIEVRFVTLSDKLFQEVLPESTMSSLNVDEAGLADSDAVQPAAFDRPLGSQEGAHVVRAQLLIEKDSPMRFRIVDKEQGEELIDRCRSDKQSNMIQAPKVTVFNGQTACVSDTCQTPFMVGVNPVGPEPHQPQIRVISEGTRLQFRPIADQSGVIHLDFSATFSQIQKVETISVSRNAGGVETVSFSRTPTDGTAIQIPKVATIRVEGGASLKPGQWLLLSGSDITDQMTATKIKADWPVSWINWLVGGWKHQEPHETESLILMLRAEKIATDPQRTDSNAEHSHP
jgi:general secretion pathway protein D